jgi:hypothetical protein
MWDPLDAPRPGCPQKSNLQERGPWAVKTPHVVAMAMATWSMKRSLLWGCIFDYGERLLSLYGVEIELSPLFCG